MEQQKPQNENKDKQTTKDTKKSDATPISRDKKRNSLGPGILWEELP